MRVRCHAGDAVTILLLATFVIRTLLCSQSALGRWRDPGGIEIFRGHFDSEQIGWRGIGIAAISDQIARSVAEPIN